MELTRAKPRQLVEFRVPLSEPEYCEEEMNQYAEQLKGFVQSVLIGNPSLMYNKMMIMEYINEAIRRNKAAELSAQLDQHLKTTIESMINNANAEYAQLESKKIDNEKRNEQVLNRIELCWCHLRSALSELIQVCSQLQSAETGGFSIWKDSMQYFKNHLEASPKMKDRLMVAMLDKIAMYREGGEAIFCQFRNIVEMFTFIGSYEVFEEKVIGETRDYYRRLAVQVLSQNPVTEAYSLFRNKMRYEEECCNKYLLKPTVDKVMDTVKVQLLQLNAEALMQKSVLMEIINAVDVHTMQVLLSLYANTEWTTMLHDAIFDAAQSIGENITEQFISDTKQTHAINSPQKCFEFIKNLHQLKTRVDTTVRDTLPANVDFKAKDIVLWQKVINASERNIEAVTVALAAYADSAPAEMELEAFLSEGCGLGFIMKVFRALSNKARFEILFRGMLTSRLLYQQELKEGHEHIVSKLKEECGATYVAKLEVIINDYKSSHRVATEFSEVKDELEMKHMGRLFDFSSLLLSKDTCTRSAKRTIADIEEGAQEWEDISEKNETKPVTIEEQTQSVQRMQNEFAEFYETKNKNRYLSFLPDLGSAVLNMDINGESYELILSICQAYALLALNNEASVTLSNLREIMGEEYEDKVMRKHLAPMNAVHNPLLVFADPGITFQSCTENDSFSINPHFVPQNKVIDLQYKEQIIEQQGKAENPNNATEDITPVIEAAIVRHLKTNLSDKSSNVFKACVAKHSTLDRFEFNKILDSLAERDFVKVDTQTDTISYVP
ncbi:ubiquitin cullin 4 [Babesia ovis]|uniref:Ubiquitin cullin 4 n=1 Tax=Babesia ovis TaxID=5869 RepID=A0A9W5TAC0_BABOV|nr:ubiquitin cullin 4 [Babesia ovis]